MRHAGPIAVIDAMIAVWKDDATLAAAVKAHCGSDSVLRYFIGVDTQKLPSIENAPYMCLTPGDYQIQPDQTARPRNIKLGLIITDARMDTTTALVSKMRGLVALEALVPLLDSSLDAFFNTYAAGVVDSGQITTDILFPEFRAEWSYAFTERNT